MTETTAQDAPGSTIAACDDLRDGVFFAAPEIARAPEAVDAAGPVDAQNAPTGPWKTANGFPQAPTAIIVFLIGDKPRTGISQVGATDLRQLPSSAAVASGALFADPTPAEIVVADRQK